MIEDVLINKIKTILKNHGFYRIKYAGRHANSFHFDAFTDAVQQIRVDMIQSEVSVYKRYMTEKDYVLDGKFELS